MLGIEDHEIHDKIKGLTKNESVGFMQNYVIKSKIP